MNQRRPIFRPGFGGVLLLLGTLVWAWPVRGQLELAPDVFLLGRHQDTNINESSGVIPSHRTFAAYWTHNDGDDNLFAFTRTGRPLGKWSVPAPIQDFEDIAWSPGRLYIGDIGNNEQTNFEARVYAVLEPAATFSGSLPLRGVWRLRYPNDIPFDAEALLIHRRSGYIIAKNQVNGYARVYRFPLRAGGGTFLLEPRCELAVAAPVGGADLTRDGKRLAVITRAGPYLFELPGDVPAAGRLAPSLFVPFALDRMEGCCFTRDGLIVTTETGEILLFAHYPFRTTQRWP